MAWDILRFEDYVTANRAGWVHPDGWVLWPDGHTSAAPLDLDAPGPDGVMRSETLFCQFKTLPADYSGWHLYYNRENGSCGQHVGMPYWTVNFENGRWWEPQGWTVQWTQGAAYANGLRHFWRVDAIPRPWGLGKYFGTGTDLQLPWWNGKSFREHPPLGRGRPRLAP